MILCNFQSQRKGKHTKAKHYSKCIEKQNTNHLFSQETSRNLINTHYKHVLHRRAEHGQHLGRCWEINWVYLVFAVFSFCSPQAVRESKSLQGSQSLLLIFLRVDYVIWLLYCKQEGILCSSCLADHIVTTTFRIIALLSHAEKFHPLDISNLSISLIICHTHDAFDITNPSNTRNVCPIWN